MSSCAPTCTLGNIFFLEQFAAPGGAVVMSLFVCLLPLRNLQGLPAIHLCILLSQPSGCLASSRFQASVEAVFSSRSHSIRSVHTLCHCPCLSSSLSLTSVSLEVLLALPSQRPHGHLTPRWLLPFPCSIPLAHFIFSVHIVYFLVRTGDQPMPGSLLPPRSCPRTFVLALLILLLQQVCVVSTSLHFRCVQVSPGGGPHWSR